MSFPISKPYGRGSGLARTVFRWPDRREGPWLVELMWKEIEGREEVVGLLIRHGTGEARLDSSTLREFPLFSVAEDVRKRRIASAERTIESGGEFENPEWLKELSRRSLDRLATPRKRLPKEHFEEVAMVYRDAYEKGLFPTRHVEEVMGANTRRQAAGWVQRARGMGLLPPTERRKPKA
ncbi:MAG: hypothetical protein IIC72_11755 [Acidobacteria bacterium]|nr:hypothetical protein [Acidobacteriota bacterium]